MGSWVSRAGLVIALPCCGAPRPAVLPDVMDAARGVVLLRRSDGVERATLPLAGRVCALGETLIGLHDDSVVAHDLTDLGAPVSDEHGLQR